MGHALEDFHIIERLGLGVFLAKGRFQKGLDSGFKLIGIKIVHILLRNAEV